MIRKCSALGSEMLCRIVDKQKICRQRYKKTQDKYFLLQQAAFTLLAILRKATSILHMQACNK